MKSLLKGAVIATAICAVLFAGYLGLTRWKCIPVSANNLEVSDVSRLADGRIIYHLKAKDGKNLGDVKGTTNSDGSEYTTFMRSIIEKRQSDGSGLFKDYFMFDVAENNAYQQHHGDGIVITSCYVGPVGEGILIWEEGMDLPKASEALERLINAK